jgi:hypothetical protein
MIAVRPVVRCAHGYAAASDRGVWRRRLLDRLGHTLLDDYVLALTGCERPRVLV